MGWSGAVLLCGCLYGQAASVTSVVRADRHSGKLVRTTVVQSEAKAPVAIATAVNQIAAEHVVPPELIHSVIKVESNYNPFAISTKGALGLMQLIPATARRFGVADAFDPIENIQGGAKYLRYLLDLYHGNYALALAAYNAGEQTVARYGGVPPFPETRNYVAQVSRHLEEAGKAAGPEVKHGEPEAHVESQGARHIQEIVEPDGSVRYVSR
jgi:soluble lytic murein transglycosylase-like protein